MKIYTKTGDQGTTSLFDGTRIPKSSLRIDAYGTVDELNSALGIVLSNKVSEPIYQDILSICKTLFILGTDLATPLNYPKKINRIEQKQINWLEQKIDDYTEKLPPLRNFILPSGTICSSYLHFARTICRRAERLVVNLSEIEEVNSYAIVFLNRLSDYLFTAARYENFLSNIDDILIKE